MRFQPMMLKLATMVGVVLGVTAAHAAPFMIVGDDEKAGFADGKAVVSPPGNDAVLIVDVADPRKPRTKKFVAAPPNTRAFHLQTHGDLLLTVNAPNIWVMQGYSDPNVAMQQSFTHSDIDKKTAEIEAKKKAVAADQQAISDAESDMIKSGGAPGWAR